MTMTRKRRKPRYVDPDAVWTKRLLAGLSQTELAEKADVSQQTISLIELGKGGCSLTVLHKLAGALGCPVEEIMARRDQRGAA